MPLPPARPIGRSASYRLALTSAQAVRPGGAVRAEWRLAMANLGERFVASSLRVLSVVAVALLASKAWAADSLAQRIEACAQQKDDVARLQCFDREASGLRAERAATATRGTAASASPATNPPAHEDATSAVAPAAAPAGQPVSAHVVSVVKLPRRELRIDLDNGQTWQQLEQDDALSLSPGDSVEIKSAALGSFKLRAPSGISTKVRRIR